MYTVKQEELTEKLNDLSEKFPMFFKEMIEMESEEITGKEIMRVYAILHLLYDTDCKKDDHGNADAFQSLISSFEIATQYGDVEEMSMLVGYYDDCYDVIVE